MWPADPVSLPTPFLLPAQPPRVRSTVATSNAWIRQARLCVPAALLPPHGRPACSEGCACDNAHLWARARCARPEECGSAHGGPSYQVSWGHGLAVVRGSFHHGGQGAPRTCQGWAPNPGHLYSVVWRAHCGFTMC